MDGGEATLYQANIKNMALALDAGDHDVKLVFDRKIRQAFIFPSLTDGKTDCFQITLRVTSLLLYM